MPKTQKDQSKTPATLTLKGVTVAQLDALEDLLTFCEDVEYRNGQTLKQGRAVLRRLFAAHPHTPKES